MSIKEKLYEEYEKVNVFDLNIHMNTLVQVEKPIYIVEYYLDDTLYPLLKRIVYVNCNTNCVAKFNIRFEARVLSDFERVLFEHMGFKACDGYTFQLSNDDALKHVGKCADVSDDSDSMLSMLTVDYDKYSKKHKENREPYKSIFARLASDRFTNKDLQELTGINNGSFTRYSSGERKISKRNILKLVIIFECDRKQAIEFLRSVDYRFDKAIEVDLVVLSHIDNQDYDRGSINRILLEKGEEPLFPMDREICIK